MKTICERNHLVEKYINLAKYLAKQRYITVNKTVQYGELLSAAYCGLLDAAQRFDVKLASEKSDDPFACYARPRINGQMNDYLRSCNWGSRNNPISVASLDAHNEEVTNKPPLSETLVSRERSSVDSLNSEQLFDKLIRSLPYREKEVFRLRYLQGLTMLEIAALVNLSESRVSQILSQNMEYLRRVWKQHAEELKAEAATSA